jgi:hypothetical protein
MKTIHTVILVVLLFVVTFLIIAAILPSSYHLERRMAIKATPMEVYDEINNLENWKNWNPRMPEMEYGDITKGKGARQTWKTPEGGEGFLEILRAQPAEMVKANIRFPGYDTFETVWMLRPHNDSTFVTWGMDFDNLSYPFERYSGLLTNKRMHTNIHLGLQNLKSHLENPGKAKKQ